VQSLHGIHQSASRSTSVASSLLRMRVEAPEGGEARDEHSSGSGHGHPMGRSDEKDCSGLTPGTPASGSGEAVDARSSGKSKGRQKRLQDSVPMVLPGRPVELTKGIGAKEYGC